MRKVLDHELDEVKGKVLRKVWREKGKELRNREERKKDMLGKV